MYFANSHRLVCSLATKLGLAVESVPPNSFDVYYLRRQHVSPTMEKVPYDFTPAERAIPAPQLLPAALEKVLPGITKLHGEALDAALAKAVVNGIPLVDWGFWNLLYLAMSSEAFAFTRDTTCDDYLFMNWNAVDAIRALQLFGPSTKVFYLLYRH